LYWIDRGTTPAHGLLVADDNHNGADDAIRVSAADGAACE
jgi:hypothetical protein